MECIHKTESGYCLHHCLKCPDNAINNCRYFILKSGTEKVLDIITEEQAVRTVICLDNRGLEEWFEVGVIYAMTGYVDDKLVTVCDMDGKRHSVFSERFERIK